MDGTLLVEMAQNRSLMKFSNVGTGVFWGRRIDCRLAMLGQPLNVGISIVYIADLIRCAHKAIFLALRLSDRQLNL